MVDWATYELEVFEELKSKYPDADVLHDVRLRGTRSLIYRQIDILVTEKMQGEPVRTVVDAKHHRRRVDVNTVESFLGLLQDVGADRGILVTSAGYTRGALKRALREDVDVDLDILSLEELHEWQAYGAIAFSGRNAVTLPTPVGWVVDGERRVGAVACLYRRGLTYDDAVHEKEWMYVNFWDRRAPVRNLKVLLNQQNAFLAESFPEARITWRRISKLRPRYAIVRRADIPQYPAVEITGFVQFPKFIFFAVLFTSLETERRNTRKLEYVLSRVLPLSVRTT